MLTQANIDKINEFIAAHQDGVKAVDLGKMVASSENTQASRAAAANAFASVLRYLGVALPDRRVKDDEELREFREFRAWKRARAREAAAAMGAAE